MARDHARIKPPPMPPGVDTGRPHPRYHDGSIKRLAPPARVRRALASRYGATPGAIDHPAPCQYCGAIGHISWPNLNSGAQGSWVTFRDLTMDHIHPYSLGGSTGDADNFVLACRSCNSSKGVRLDWRVDG